MTRGDVLCEKKGGIAWITINRSEVRNAFRTRTVAELTDAFVDARWDPSVGVAVLTGAGDLYYQTEEAMEGRNAFVEKRPVNFGKYRK